jgi:uncharacterized protein
MPDRPEQPLARPWWREPMLWLVIGGPAAVVAAGLATAVIAVQGSDPVIRVEAAKPPALQERNHAATPQGKR